MNATSLALCAMVGITMTTVCSGQSAPYDAEHAVFLMTNDALSNEVIAYTRTDYGTLIFPRHFRTGGRGSGGKVDPLGAQGSLRLSADRNWLFAVNAGSGTLSVFRVIGSFLVFTNEVPTGGAEPVSVTQRGNLVYVLNAAGSSSVVGFTFDEGRLSPIDGSQRFLSANGANPGSVTFSPDGKFVLATEKANNDIDVFEVQTDGTLSAITVNPSAGPRHLCSRRGAKRDGHCFGDGPRGYDGGHLLLQHWS